MTSNFLMNKKMTIVLLVLASLIVLTSVSSVSAYDDTNVTLSFADGSLSKNVTSDGVAIKGSVVNTTNNTSFPTKSEGKIHIFVNNTAGVISKVVELEIGNEGSFSYTLPQTLFPTKGNYGIYAVFVNSTGVWEDNASVELSLIKNIVPAIIVNAPPGTKVGIPQTWTVTVRENGTNPATNVSGIMVFYKDINGNIVNNTTNVNGQATFLITLSKVSQLLQFWTLENDTLFFEAAYNNYTTVNVAKATGNLTVSFDNPFGYVVGETAKISWNITSGIDLTGRFVTILMYENGRLQHSFSVLASDLCTNYTWLKAHETLDVFVVLPEDFDVARMSGNNTTFVDASAASRRTTLNITGLADLAVGKNSTILVQVLDYMGLPINTGGKVTLKFDNFDPFVVDVDGNGVASFTHIFSKAGANRNLVVSFLGEGNNSASQKTQNVTVAKGNATLVANMIPGTSMVGGSVNIAAAVSNMTFNTVRYVTFTFWNNNVLQHTVKAPITATGNGTSGNAQFDYVFLKQHTLLTIVASFDGDSDYNAVNSTITTTVDKAFVP